MNKRYLLFFSLFIILINVLFSQNQNPTPSNNILDAKYTPANTSVLHDLTSINPNQQSALKSPKNIITYDVGLMFRSVASVNYERVLARWLSVQVGIGVTFARDAMQSTFLSAGMIVQSNSYDNEVSLTDILRNSSRHQAGLYVAGGFKLYIKGTAPISVFLQPCVSFAQYGLKLNESYYSNPNTYTGIITDNLIGSPNINIQNIDYKLHWGCQFASGGKKARFVHTVYAGMGVRTITYNKLIITQVPGGLMHTTYPEYSWGNKTTALVPTVSFGYCLGLGF